MKTSLRFQSQRSRNWQQGAVAVVVMLALLLMIVIYLGANVRSLNSLHRELKLVEQKQVQRLATIQATMPVLLFPNPPAALTNAAHPAGILPDSGMPARSMAFNPSSGTGELP